MNAIETTYKGYKFRSRLEAKWACMFDALGWKWEYEPVDLNGYIPDFYVDFGRQQYFVEIKPAMNRDELRPALTKAEAAIRQRDEDVLVLGGSMGSVDDHGRWNPTALMSQYCYDIVYDVYFAGCPTCRTIVPLTMYGIWGFPCCAVPNGDNKHYGHELPVDEDSITRAWAVAHNATKWKPRAR